MFFFSPITALKKERIQKWLERVEFAELQKSLDILIEEQFSLAKDTETKDPVGFLTSNDIKSNSKQYIEKAMRLKICSDVLDEIIQGKIELKTINHGSEQTQSNGTGES